MKNHISDIPALKRLMPGSQRAGKRPLNALENEDLSLDNFDKLEGQLNGIGCGHTWFQTAIVSVSVCLGFRGQGNGLLRA